MSVAYSKEQRSAAEASGRKLVTLAAAGLEFQEAVDAETEEEIIRFILDIRRKVRQRASGCASSPSTLTAPFLALDMGGEA